MYLIDRFSQLLRCDVALHFINTWDINDLTVGNYWKKLQLPFWHSFVLEYHALYLQDLMLIHVHRIEIPYQAFPKRVGPRILSLESVDYFRTSDYFSGR